MMIKNKAKPLTFFGAAMLMTWSAYGQHSANASGGDAGGSGGTSAYSVGQVVYTTHTGTTGTSTQGVQQALEIVSVGAKETPLDIALNAFPNPAVENLTLRVSNYINPNLDYQVLDLQQKLISNSRINSENTIVDMSNLPAGTYFININQDNKKIQSFKIIKQ